MPTADLSLAPEPSSVGAARRFLRATLEQWGVGELEYAANQALTELATNAVIHARTPFEVTIEWADDVLRVLVVDRSPQLPVQRSYRADAATGRGLAVVSSLCRSWGSEPRAGGKAVWFDLTRGSARAVADHDVVDLLALGEPDAAAASGTVLARAA